MRFRHVAVFALLLLAAGWVAGCASGGVSQPKAFTNPNMDFARINTLGVLPLFPTQVEDQVFSGAFTSALESSLTTRQSQWRLISYREMLQIVNNNNLGTGYKNLQADFNAPSTGMGQVVFSPATNQFVQSLRRVAKTDAFLIGTYSLDQPLLPGRLGMLLPLKTGTEVRVSLLYMNGTSLESWWSAVVKRPRISDEVILDMAASVAANIGKGTYRQL